jgi:transposase
MFQDEARFGRMSNPRPCWAPPGVRPMVPLALVREYTYAYCAVSPADGLLHTRVAARMDVHTMSAFLRQIARSHPDEFIIMVLDGAPSHRGGQLVVPENMRLLPLPPYSPELNPAELLWDELREKEFANRLFDTLQAVKQQLRQGLVRLRRKRDVLMSLTGWNWIIRSL